MSHIFYCFRDIAAKTTEIAVFTHPIVSFRPKGCARTDAFYTVYEVWYHNNYSLWTTGSLKLHIPVFIYLDIVSECTSLDWNLRTTGQYLCGCQSLWVYLHWFYTASCGTKR